MKIVIVGAGGHAKVVCDALLAEGISPPDILGFVDDDSHKHGDMALGFHVLGKLESLTHTNDVELAMGIGDNAARAQMFDRARRLGCRFRTVIHPSAVIGRECRLGEGTVVLANAVVNTGTNVGEDVILNTSCSVDHDCAIGSHAHIAPGARLAGGVTVGEGTLIGMGAVAIPGVRIGGGTVVGAGAVVVRDLPDRCLAAGVPARVVKSFGGESS